ncbi:AAA family ATPase [Limimaricola pyoseonensis]|uniref:Adenylate kinase n=1 Tax=Limimaricola pyoseonensis TaxID=521013 RepID=A0A1G7ER85_9RHOB|nr:AAA family ATPase [Limimaricola pyoseonensis]SDE66220.1 Adenylate kinase [Limimaricola pyoseonensis]
MKRVMIIGQPGAGKSWLARRMGEITHLPVVHVDHVHWAPGWVERSRAEKTALCAEIHARPEWIFEGNHSASFEERLARADTVIWLDLPVGLRLRRLAWRSLRDWGRHRPDMAPGCRERPSPEFLRWVWATRATMRAKLRWFYKQVPHDKDRYHLRSRAEVAAFLDGLRTAVAVGNLGIPHR